jgi:hypothetical protein
MDGKILNTYESLKDAAEKTKLTDVGIVKVCRGHRQTCGGYKWSYSEKNPNDCEIDLKGFVPINDFPSYQISKEGVVYNTSFKKILKQQTNNDGYKAITIVNNKNKKSFLVHRLVAEHFRKKIKGKDLVNHKDGTRTNNHVNNLEWVNNSENVNHGHNLRKKNLAKKL